MRSPGALRALGSTPSRGGLFLAPKMSDDFEEKAAAVPAAKVPRKRPAARKTAKAKPAAEAATPVTPASEVAAPKEERQAAPAPVTEDRSSESRPPREFREPREPREAREPRDRESADRDAAPEPIPFFVENGSSEPPGNNKKRRRRKKKHGQPQGGQHPHAVAPSAEVPHAAPEAAAPAPAPAPVMHAAPRPKLDSDEVSKKAWKIFLSEVGEEGLALIDDHDAREISRRCFRLAEIFLEEAARRSR